MKRLSIFFVWVWCLTLLIASVGVSVNRIYCSCLHEETLSLLPVTDDPCQQEEADCCASSESSCCAKPDAQKETHDCTRTTTEYKSIKTDLSTQEKGETLEGNPKIGDLELITARPSEITLSEDSPLISGLSVPPDKPFGRTLCIRFQVFRC